LYCFQEQQYRKQAEFERETISSKLIEVEESLEYHKRLLIIKNKEINEQSEMCNLMEEAYASAANEIIEKTEVIGKKITERCERVNNGWDEIYIFSFFMFLCLCLCTYFSFSSVITVCEVRK
jgi:hypothetical protein